MIRNESFYSPALAALGIIIIDRETIVTMNDRYSHSKDFDGKDFETGAYSNYTYHEIHDTRLVGISLSAWGIPCCT